MTDRRDDEETPDERPRTTPEGVRILGAEEAQAALEGGQVARRRGDDELRYGDVPARPKPPSRPTVRFPLPDSGPDVSGPQPTEPAGGSRDERRESDAGEPSEPVKLPHWTEPPTGEVLQILPEAEPVDVTGEDDLEGWSALSGQEPRFRSGAGDWAEGDYQPGEALKDDATSIGALAEHTEHPNDDVSFDEEVAARRRGSRRISATAGRAAGAGAAAERAPAARRSDRPRRRPGLEPEPETETETPIAPSGEPPQPTATVRVLSGLGIAAVGLLCLALGPRTATALVALVAAIGAVEIYTAFQQQGYHPATLVGVIGSAGLVIAAYNRGVEAFPLVTALVVVFTMLWYLFEVVHARPTVNLGLTLAGFCYVGILGGFGGLLLQARPQNHGVGLVLGVAICAVGHDVIGYVVGSQFGRRRITPKISPNKTLEGLLGGMAGAIVLGVFVTSVLKISPWDLSTRLGGNFGRGLALGVVVAVVAPLGDLCESMLKRDLGVKDLGAIFPGHGGALDRFDAILFCLPAVYYLARFLKIA